MILHIHWRPERAADPATERHRRFTRTLDYAAKHTRFYRYTPNAVKELPPIELLDYLRHPERYEVPFADAHPRHPLDYPLGKAPRTAVLGPEIRGSWRVRCFDNYRSPKLRQFAPAALAGPCDSIRALAQSIEEGEISSLPLRNALVVFTDIVRGALSQEDREYFWRVFEVPVFEQFRGFAGELLAQECEVHHGLHIQRDNLVVEQEPGGQFLFSFLGNPKAPLFRLASNLTGQILEEPCPCGNPAPRLLQVRRRALRAVSRPQLAVVNS